MPVLGETEGMAVPGYFTMDGDTGLLAMPDSSSSYFRDRSRKMSASSPDETASRTVFMTARLYLTAVEYRTSDRAATRLQDPSKA